MLFCYCLSCCNFTVLSILFFYLSNTNLYVKDISLKLYILWEKVMIVVRMAEISSFSHRMYSLSLLSYLKLYLLCVNIWKYQVSHFKLWYVFYNPLSSQVSTPRKSFFKYPNNKNRSCKVVPFVYILGCFRWVLRFIKMCNHLILIHFPHWVIQTWVPMKEREIKI